MSLTDPLPSLKPSLVVKKREGTLPQQYEVEDPSRDISFAFQEFELSLARMLNGRRTAAEVVEAAHRIGIPLTPEKLASFIQKLSKAGLLCAPDEVPPLQSGSPLWPPRAQWGLDLRERYQNALRLVRSDRLVEAKAELNALLQAQPENAEVAQLLSQVEQLLAPPPELAPAPSFSEVFEAAERSWFQAGEEGRSVEPISSPRELSLDADDKAELRPSRLRPALIGLAGLLVVGLVVGLVPFPVEVQGTCTLRPATEHELRAPTKVAVKKVLSPKDGAVAKDAPLIELAQVDPKPRLDELAAREKALRGELRAAETPKVAKALAAHRKLENQLAKTVAERDKLKSKPNKKALAKAEKKVAALDGAVKKSAAKLPPDLAGKRAELLALDQQRKQLLSAPPPSPLLAPAAGVVSQVLAEDGKSYEADAVLLKLADVGTLRAEATLRGSASSKVAKGQELVLSFAGKKQPLRAAIDSVSPTEGGVKAVAVVKNPTGSVAAGEAKATVEGVTASLLGRLFGG